MGELGNKFYALRRRDIAFMLKQIGAIRLSETGELAVDLHARASEPSGPLTQLVVDDLVTYLQHLAYLKNIEPDAVVGTERTGVPFAKALAKFYQNKKIGVIELPKWRHGEKSHVAHPTTPIRVPLRRVLLLTGSIKSGRTVREAVDVLRDMNSDLKVAVLTIIDETGIGDLLAKEKSCEIFSVFTGRELIGMFAKGSLREPLPAPI